MFAHYSFGLKSKATRRFMSGLQAGMFSSEIVYYGKFRNAL